MSKIGYEVFFKIKELDPTLWLIWVKKDCAHLRLCKLNNSAKPQLVPTIRVYIWINWTIQSLLDYTWLNVFLMWPFCLFGPSWLRKPCWPFWTEDHGDWPCWQWRYRQFWTYINLVTTVSLHKVGFIDHVSHDFHLENGDHVDHIELFELAYLVDLLALLTMT